MFDLENQGQTNLTQEGRQTRAIHGHCYGRLRDGTRCFTQDLADVGVVHVWEGLQDLAPLILGPHHESVHRPLDVGLVGVPASRLPVDPGLGSAGAPCWPRTTKTRGLFLFFCSQDTPRREAGEEREERAKGSC